MFSKKGRLIGTGGMVALWAFFLPWVLVSCQDQPIASLSGWRLAAGGTIQIPGGGAQPLDSSPSLFLVLLTAIICIALAVRVYQGQTVLRRAAFGAIGLALLSLALLFIKFVGILFQSEQGPQVQTRYGFWATVLALIAIVVGGIKDLGKREAAAAAAVPVEEAEKYESFNGPPMAS
jgi:hypothetical protein